jgi:hypothetical protein
MNVRHVVLGRPGRAGAGDRVTLPDDRAALHEQRPEMGQRDLVPARGEDRDCQPVRRNPTGEGDVPTRRGTDDLGVSESEVDAAMLAAEIGVVADREATQDLSLRGPRPGACARNRDERPDEERQQDRASRCRMR